MQIQVPAIDEFSKHLFWDVNRENLDIEKDKSYIIWQVLEFGLMDDWFLIRNYYGVKQIGEIATSFRSMDKKNLSLISYLSGIPKENFRCYTTQQSNPPHWNF